MIRLVTSNRLEKLVDALAERIKTSPPGPFQQETIVVQSRGMDRWLSMRLAERLRVWAGAVYPFPEKLVWDCFTALLDDLPDTSVFDRRVLQWRVMEVLPDFASDETFAQVNAYLADDDRGLKRYQLSRYIAQTFDQYVIFRPEMIEAWEGGTNAGWQSVLWRALANGHENEHRAAVWRRFRERLTRDGVPRDLVPGGRLSVFGISALPPFYVDVLSALGSGEKVDVDIYVLNPCREYWSDIMRERDAARIAKLLKKPVDDRDLHLETGNRLLASWGVLGRDFLECLHALSPQEHSSYEPPQRGTLLCAIQSDILELRNAGDDGPPMPFPSGDGSLKVHSCHSPMREVEVLQDRLLRLFEDVPDLTPEEIIVMAPEIETYSPLIDSVFSLGPGDPRYLPFTVADRTLRSRSHVVETVFRLLSIRFARFRVSEVMEVLECPAVLLRFGLQEDDIPAIHRWLEDTRVRWGLDADHRQRLGMPAMGENSWGTGLDRMLLGYALPGSAGALVHEIAPYGEIEGSDARILGGLAEFMARMKALPERLDQERTLPGWAGEVGFIVESFFHADGGDERGREDMGLVQEAAWELAGDTERAGAREMLGVDVFRTALEQSLADRFAHPPFLAGGITFCKLLPMRSIPFRVVCLLGMNNGQYPRSQQVPGFDLMAEERRRGDRSRRRDDQYLFLEALLSARDHLHISYVGQSVRDNSPIPPSVLVSELLEYVETGYAAGNGSVEDLLVRHPLQPFSRRYFSGREEGLFSYSPEYCTAAEALHSSLAGNAGPAFPSGSLFSVALEEPGPEFRDVTIAELQRFFVNPVRHLMEKRLDLHLRRDASGWNDRELLVESPLDRSILRSEVLALCREGLAAEEMGKVLAARGLLPWGGEGTRVCREVVGEVTAFVKRVEGVGAGDRLGPCVVAVDVDPFRVTGTIDEVFCEGAVVSRPSEVRPKDRLRTWVQHLVMASSQEGYPPRSVFAGMDGVRSYEGVENPRALLAGLLDLYWRGLSTPLPFFPKASFAYAEKLRSGGTPAAALAAAQGTWVNDRGGERETCPYLQLVFRESDSLCSGFAAAAQAVLEPLLQYEKEGGP